MQKGYKRDGKAIAVLHFFIGLIIVAILVGVVYFFLQKMDYSDKLADPQASVRPYVETTPTPEPTPLTGANALLAEPYSTSDALVDLTATDTPEPTPEPTATPEPTPIPTPSPIPTPTPEPTPTPTPTPQPTKIPSNKLAKARTKGFNVPAPATNATVAISDLYISEPNKNSYVEIKGYGYIDDASFDGSDLQIYLIVTQQDSGKQIAYKANMRSGVSGVSHDGAQCKNAADTDFDVIFNVKKYPDGNYNLGVVLYYKLNGSKAYSYHVFPETISVSDGAASEGLAGSAFSAPSAFQSDAFQSDASDAPAAAATPTSNTDAFGAPLDGSTVG